MNNQQFIEQLCIVGTIMAYTTAVLFLSWSVWKSYVLWVDLKIKVSEGIREECYAKERLLHLKQYESQLKTGSHEYFK